jgi:hypothetical protein
LTSKLPKNDTVSYIRDAKLTEVIFRAVVTLLLWLETDISEAMLFDKLSDYQIFKEYPAPWSE